MRTGYIVETHRELSQKAVGILVFNYVFYSQPCEVVNYIIPYQATKEEHPNALGRWNVKLKTK